MEPYDEDWQREPTIGDPRAGMWLTIALWLGFLALWFGAVGSLVYVAVHFARKYW
jgi:hypothetical protein